MKNPITKYLDEIKAMFPFSTTITLVIRSDEMEQDMIITDDDLGQVAGSILRGDANETRSLH